MNTLVEPESDSKTNPDGEARIQALQDLPLRIDHGGLFAMLGPAGPDTSVASMREGEGMTRFWFCGLEDYRRWEIPQPAD